MSWTQRITAGLAVGAAALALPLAASPASASDWELDSGWPSHAICVEEGESFINEDSDHHDYTEYKCEQGESYWLLYMR